MRLLGDEGDTSVMAGGYVMAATDFEVLTAEPAAGGQHAERPDAAR